MHNRVWLRILQDRTLSLKENMKKTTILTLSDHPISPSGVGTQTRYMIEHLLRTGKYRVISLGGAIKHNDYTPQSVEGYGDDWVIYPVDGYGNADMVRSILQTERLDVIWFMTTFGTTSLIQLLTRSFMIQTMLLLRFQK